MHPALSNITPQYIVEITGKISLLFILPQILLISGGLLTMIISAFTGNNRIKKTNYYLAVLFFAAAAAASLYLITLKPGDAFNGMVRSDMFSGMLNIIYSLTGLLITFTAHSYFNSRGCYIYEMYPLFLFSASGMMFMTGGSDLMVIFIGLEILSVSLYVLTGIDLSDPGSNESSVKYFLMGVFASAFLLYGIAFLYGATGTTSLRGIAGFINAGTGPANIYISAGIVLLLAGFGFKISMVPFHMWTPDVYQGAPLVITAFISTAPKAAALLTLIRVLLIVSPQTASAGWLPDLISFFAIVTMTAGNLLALSQSDLKRIMAFSSIAHIGYMLVAFASFSSDAVSSVLFYFSAYILMNLGLFAILAIAARDGDRNLTLSGIQGLAKGNPLFGLFLIVFIFSLAGIPPTAGFSAKFFIFSTAVESELYYLAVIGILNSAISAYYYLRILLHVYIKDPADESELPGNITINTACFAVLLISLTGTLWLGIIPAALMEFAKKAILFL